MTGAISIVTEKARRQLPLSWKPRQNFPGLFILFCDFEVGYFYPRFYCT